MGSRSRWGQAFSIRIFGAGATAHESSQGGQAFSIRIQASELKGVGPLVASFQTPNNQGQASKDYTTKIFKDSQLDNRQRIAESFPPYEQNYISGLAYG
jgi:hypothetical protein